MTETKTTDVQKMTTEALAKFSADVLEVWKSQSAIRKVFAPKLSDDEFKFFMGMGLALKANPFKREIFAVKYTDSEPAQIVVARSLYKRRAQEQKDYGGCIIEAVYPGEKFEPNPFDPLKTVHIIDYKLRDKDDVIPFGAYFIGIYNDGKQPLWHFVRTKEYIQWIRDKQTGKLRPNKFWASSPETMIKKVVDSQGHRLMYEGIFSGTVTEEEVQANAHRFETEETEEPGIDVMSELDQKIKEREPKAEAEKKPEGQAEAFENSGHDWPLWKGYDKENVQRKFKYVRNELFQKYQAGLKAMNIHNLMQLAMYLFDASDFQPDEISPDDYDYTLEWIKNPTPREESEADDERQSH